MTDRDAATKRQARARAAAHRLGLVVTKTPANNTYALIDPAAPVRPVVAGAHSYGLSLDDLEAELEARWPRRQVLIIGGDSAR